MITNCHIWFAAVYTYAYYTLYYYTMAQWVHNWTAFKERPKIWEYDADIKTTYLPIRAAWLTCIYRQNGDASLIRIDSLLIENNAVPFIMLFFFAANKILISISFGRAIKEIVSARWGLSQCNGTYYIHLENDSFWSFFVCLSFWWY